MAKQARQSATSQILASIVKQIQEKHSVSFKDITELLKERVFGMSILIFCIPNCLPIPNIPGLSALTGIPIALLGLQMIMGRTHPWLPAALGKKRFSGKRLGKFLKRAIPPIKKIEFLLHPRLQWMTSSPVKRLLGVAFVAFAIVLSLPIPFGNMLPGFAMALMAIGLIESDGVVIVLGLIFGAATVVLMCTVADAIVSAMQSLF